MENRSVSKSYFQVDEVLPVKEDRACPRLKRVWHGDCTIKNCSRVMQNLEPDRGNSIINRPMMKCFAVNDHKRVRSRLALRPPDRLSTDWEIRCRYANYFKLPVLLKSLARSGVAYGLSLTAADCTPPAAKRALQVVCNSDRQLSLDFSRLTC